MRFRNEVDRLASSAAQGVRWLAPNDAAAMGAGLIPVCSGCGGGGEGGAGFIAVCSGCGVDRCPISQFVPSREARVYDNGPDAVSCKHRWGGKAKAPVSQMAGGFAV
jgi:hypothetical protein